MQTPKLISAGKIVGVHGIRGGLKVLSYLEKPENFGHYKKFYIDNKEIELELNFVKNTVAVIDITGLRKREIAETYIGKEIFIDKSELPETKADEFYYSDLVGIKVMNKDKEIGTLTAIENFGAGDLFEITFSDKTKGQKLFPFKKEIFPEINTEKGFVQIVFPEEEFDN